MTLREACFLQDCVVYEVANRDSCGSERVMAGKLCDGGVDFRFMLNMNLVRREKPLK